MTNYLRISDNIGTAGQPTKEQFTGIKAEGYEVVINLAMPTSSNYNPEENKIVSELGMKYIHVPVVWTSPKREKLEQFFELMDQYQTQQVFVHCAMNWRVSCFVFLYQVMKQNIPLAKAREILLKIWEPDEVWQSFIDKTLMHDGIQL